jgi:hypothetical protein
MMRAGARQLSYDNAAPIRWEGSVRQPNYAFLSVSFGFSAAESWPMR